MPSTTLTLPSHLHGSSHASPHIAMHIMPLTQMFTRAPNHTPNTLAYFASSVCTRCMRARHRLPCHGPHSEVALSRLNTALHVSPHIAMGIMPLTHTYTRGSNPTPCTVPCLAHAVVRGCREAKIGHVGGHRMPRTSQSSSFLRVSRHAL